MNYWCKKLDFKSSKKEVNLLAYKFLTIYSLKIDFIYTIIQLYHRYVTQKVVFVSWYWLSEAAQILDIKSLCLDLQHTCIRNGFMHPMIMLSLKITAAACNAFISSLLVILCYWPSIIEPSNFPLLFLLLRCMFGQKCTKKHTH